MKRKILTLVLIIITSYSYGQTYTFSKVIKKATVQTSSGNQQKVIGTYQGPYQFIFETPSDPQVKRLFTLLNPGQVNAPGLSWYGLLKEQGYIEKDGKLLKKNLYFDTGANEQVMVLIADDYSIIVILRSDDTIWEYIK